MKHVSGFSLAVLLVLSGLISGRAGMAQPGRESPDGEQRLRLVFGGDIMGHDSQISSALATGEPGYDYSPNYRYLKGYLGAADMAIGNLELTLAGAPYKGYPAFSSPDEIADALKEAGFDILLTANNHGLDRGRKGLERTIDQLDSRSLIQTGTFRDSLDRARRYPLLVEKKGIRIAVLNFSYGTNGIPDRPPTIINRIDRNIIEEDLKKAKSAKPDFILVVAHWGREYERFESKAQHELADFLFAHGVDAIIGSHPHVVQPIRGSKRGNLVAYSLGNLISNQRKRFRDGGILLELELVKNKEGARIANPGYLPVWVAKPKTAAGSMFTLLPAAVDPGKIPGLDLTAADRIRMKQFLEETRQHLSGQREIKPDWL